MCLPNSQRHRWHRQRIASVCKWPHSYRSWGATKIRKWEASTLLALLLTHCLLNCMALQVEFDLYILLFAVTFDIHALNFSSRFWQRRYCEVCLICFHLFLSFFPLLFRPSFYCLFTSFFWYNHSRFYIRCKTFLSVQIPVGCDVFTFMCPWENAFSSLFLLCVTRQTSVKLEKFIPRITHFSPSRLFLFLQSCIVSKV